MENFDLLPAQPPFTYIGDSSWVRGFSKFTEESAQKRKHIRLCNSISY
jgi:hypothetical protein